MTNTGNDPMIDGRLRYRVLTGPDTSEFCERVSQALADGYVLSGPPAITHNGETAIVAQAVVLPEVVAVTPPFPTPQGTATS